MAGGVSAGPGRSWHVGPAPASSILTLITVNTSMPNKVNPDATIPQAMVLPPW
jgi:hypothetical protein